MRPSLSSYLSSLAMQKLNPDPLGLRSSKADVRPSKLEKAPLKMESEGSVLEIKFLDLWKNLGGPELKREHRFHPERKWRLDFFHEASKTAIEIDGGIWVKSGHSSGHGIMRDMEKANELTFMEHHLFRLCDKTITADNLKRIISFIRLLTV